MQLAHHRAERSMGYSAERRTDLRSTPSKTGVHTFLWGQVVLWRTRCELEAVCEPAREQVLERFGSNRLGDAPGEFLTYKQRINLKLTVFTHADSIPRPSEAPPAVDSTESCCSRSVGSWDGSSLRPWRRPQLAANPHPRPPFTTTAASTTLSHTPGRLFDVPGV